MIPILVNKDNTLGIIRAEHPEKLTRIAGYFNTDFMKDLIPIFKLCDTRDMALYFSEKDGAAILLFRPDETKDIFFTVVGKTEAEY